MAEACTLWFPKVGFERVSLRVTWTGDHYLASFNRSCNERTNLILWRSFSGKRRRVFTKQHFSVSFVKSWMNPSIW